MHVGRPLCSRSCRLLNRLPCPGLPCPTLPNRQLLYNFIYKSPTIENFTTAVGAVDLLRFLCSRDLTIAQAICRLFHWCAWVPVSPAAHTPPQLPRALAVRLGPACACSPSACIARRG